MKFVRLFILSICLASVSIPGQESNQVADVYVDDPGPLTMPQAPEAPRSPQGQGVQDRVVFGSFLLKTNQVVGDLVVIGGSAEVHGTVEGDLVVIGGKATIHGEVERDAVIVLGGIEMTQGAKIGHDAVFIGGPFRLASGAVIGGKHTEVPIGDFVPQIEWFKEWLKQCLLLGRLLSFGLVWPWVAFGLFLMLYCMLLLVFPGAVKGTVTAIEERPVASLFAGLLTLIFFAPFLVVLAVTVVGIFIIPFVILALFVAILFGKTAVLCFVGRSISRNLAATSLEHPVLAFIIGAILVSLAYTLPIAGLIAFAAATVFGLGGAMVALSGNFSREESSVPPVPVVVGTLRAPAGSPAAAMAGSAMPHSLESLTAAANLDPADSILLPRAGFWKRTIAASLDLVLLSLLLPFTGPLFILVSIGYFVAMWTWKGTTIGSLVLGLKLVRADGSPMTFSVALVRSLSSLFSALVFFLGFLWVGWDREKQAWHDKIAGTVVVQMPRDFALI